MAMGPREALEEEELELEEAAAGFCPPSSCCELYA
jgi:hypothetical protein